MSFKDFLKSKVFIYQIVIAVIITIVLVYIAMFSIRTYTNHGESLAVPDFQGVSLQDLGDLIEENNLRYEILDSVYSQDITPGTVIDQSPVAGFHVKEGRTIFVTVSAVSPEQVAMPKLTDISFRQAQNIMQTTGLVVGKVTYVSSEYANLVLSQKIDNIQIEAGEMVNKGSRVDLTVGKSMSGELTVVPDLIGATLEQANEEIDALSLTTGAVIYDNSFETLEDSLDACVWKQYPKSSLTKNTEKGTSVDLWLTIDPEKLLGDQDGGIQQEEDNTENDFF